MFGCSWAQIILISVILSLNLMERDRSQTHFVVVVVVDTIFRKRGLGTQTLVLLEDLNRQNMNKCGTNLQFYSMISIS